MIVKNKALINLAQDLHLFDGSYDEEELLKKWMGFFKQIYRLYYIQIKALPVIDGDIAARVPHGKINESLLENDKNWYFLAHVYDSNSIILFIVDFDEVNIQAEYVCPVSDIVLD